VTAGEVRVLQGSARNKARKKKRAEKQVSIGDPRREVETPSHGKHQPTRKKKSYGGKRPGKDLQTWTWKKKGKTSGRCLGGICFPGLGGSLSCNKSGKRGEDGALTPSKI